MLDLTKVHLGRLTQKKRRLDPPRPIEALIEIVIGLWAAELIQFIEEQLLVFLSILDFMDAFEELLPLMRYPQLLQPLLVRSSRARIRRLL